MLLSPARFLAIIGTLFGIAAPTIATGVTEPRGSVSSNGKFAVRPNRSTSKLEIRPNKPGQTSALWSFPYRNAREHAFVSDDGEHAVSLFVGAVDDLQTTMALRFWNRHGEVASHPLTIVVADAKPVGAARFFGFNAWFDEATVRGDRLIVVTREHTKLTYAMVTGVLERAEDVPQPAGFWTIYLTYTVLTFLGVLALTVPIVVRLERQ